MPFICWHTGTEAVELMEGTNWLTQFGLLGMLRPKVKFGERSCTCHIQPERSRTTG